MSMKASSREQMNVSLSRGRDGIRIYTDNQAEVARACASRSAARGSALDFLGQEKDRAETPPQTARKGNHDRHEPLARGFGRSGRDPR